MPLWVTVIVALVMFLVGYGHGCADTERDIRNREQL